MRSPDGETWLGALSTQVGKRVYCAADFAGRPRQLLEARRREHYATMPVQAGWHEAYARGLARVDDFDAARSLAGVGLRK
jgi:hypothetical protein